VRSPPPDPRRPAGPDRSALSFERLEHKEANPPPYARPINRRYYWIDFKRFSDVVRWRMDILFNSLDKKLRAVRRVLDQTPALRAPSQAC
jgi:hypothetical protein